MSNVTLINNLVAKAALRRLKNNFVLANMVYRGYESEFAKKVNGYMPGDTISIRKPAQGVVRHGQVMAPQDMVEGSTSITLDRTSGYDFNFSGIELVTNIGLTDIAERVIEDAMIKLADDVDLTLFGLYKDVPNWVGTPGTTLSSYDSFAAGTERLNNLAVPKENRYACLSPKDKRGMLANLTGPQSLYNEQMVKESYRRGLLGDIDGVDTYDAQNVAVHVTGTRAQASSPVNNGGVPTTYLATKDTGVQTLPVTLAAGETVKAGDVFTLAGVFDVNPVNHATLDFLKQFVVTADATADGAGAATLTIAPAMIATGAYQNISAAPASNAVITWVGAASTGYRQNMIFHRDAFALVIVPMISPPGAIDVKRESSEGISIRSIPVWDGQNNNSAWRLDLLYGVKTIDPRLATRISG